MYKDEPCILLKCDALVSIQSIKPGQANSLVSRAFAGHQDSVSEDIVITNMATTIGNSEPHAKA